MRAIKLYRVLHEGKDAAGWVIGKQFLRSAISIGANIEEGQSGESNADFIHKYSISQKEARESLYWLRLIDKSEMVASVNLQPIIEETREILAIITSIIVKIKNKK